jgi:hypothetical protein
VGQGQVAVVGAARPCCGEMLLKDHYAVDFQEYVEREILSQTTTDLLGNPEPVEK